MLHSLGCARFTKSYRTARSLFLYRVSSLHTKLPSATESCDSKKEASINLATASVNAPSPHTFSVAYRCLKSCFAQHDTKIYLSLEITSLRNKVAYKVYDGAKKDTNLLSAVIPSKGLSHRESVELAYLGALRFRFPEHYASLIKSVSSLALVNIWKPVILYLLLRKRTFQMSLRSLVSRLAFVTEQIQKNKESDTFTVILTLHAQQKRELKYTMSELTLCKYHVYVKALEMIDSDIRQEWDRILCSLLNFTKRVSTKNFARVLPRKVGCSVVLKTQKLSNSDQWTASYLVKCSKSEHKSKILESGDLKSHLQTSASNKFIACLQLLKLLYSEMGNVFAVERLTGLIEKCNKLICSDFETTKIMLEKCGVIFKEAQISIAFCTLTFWSFMKGRNTLSLWIGTDSSKTFMRGAAEVIQLQFKSETFLSTQEDNSELNAISASRNDDSCLKGDYEAQSFSILSQLKSQLKHEVSVSYDSALPSGSTDAQNTPNINIPQRCKVTLKDIDAKTYYEVESEHSAHRLTLTLLSKAYMNTVKSPSNSGTNFLLTPWILPPVRCDKTFKVLVEGLIWRIYGIRFEIVVNFALDRPGYEGFAVLNAEKHVPDNAAKATDRYITLKSTSALTATMLNPLHCLAREHGLSHEQCVNKVYAALIRELLPELTKDGWFSSIISNYDSHSFLPKPSSSCMLQTLRDSFATCLGEPITEFYCESEKNVKLCKGNDQLSQSSYHGALASLLRQYRQLLKHPDFSSMQQRIIAAEATLLKGNVTRFHAGELYFMKHVVKNELGMELWVKRKYDTSIRLWCVQITLFGQNNHSHELPPVYAKKRRIATTYALMDFCRSCFMQWFERRCETFFDIRGIPLNFIRFQNAYDPSSILHIWPKPKVSCTLSIVLEIFARFVQQSVSFKLTQDTEGGEYTAQITAIPHTDKKCDLLTNSTTNNCLLHAKGPSPISCLIQLFEKVADPNSELSEHMRHEIRTRLQISSEFCNIGALRHMMLYHFGCDIGLKVKSSRHSDSVLHIYICGSDGCFGLGHERGNSLGQTLRTLTLRMAKNHMARFFYMFSSTCSVHWPNYPSMEIPSSDRVNTLQLMREATASGYGYTLKESISRMKGSFVRVTLRRENGAKMFSHSSRSLPMSLMHSYGALLKRNRAAMKCFQDLEKNHCYSPSSVKDNDVELLRYIVRYELGLDLDTVKKTDSSKESSRHRVLLFARNETNNEKLCLSISFHSFDSVVAEKMAAIAAINFHFPFYFFKHKLRIPRTAHVFGPLNSLNKS